MNNDSEIRSAQEPAQAILVEQPKSPSVVMHLLCGWPLVLVLVGGAIGGGLGGAAYAVNVAIYKSKLPVIAKVALNLVVGVAAIGIWLAIALAIQSSRG